MNYVFTYYCYCCLLLLIVSIVAMNCLLVSSSWVVAIAMMNIIDVLQWKWWCNCCSVFSCDVYFANAILNVNCYDSAVVLDCYCCIIFWASGNRFWENTSPRDLIGEKRVSFRPSFWSNKTHQSTPKNSRNGTPNTILRVSLPPNSRFPKVFPTSQPSQQLFKRDQLEHLRLHRHLEAQHRTTLMGDANFKTSPSSFFLEIKNLGFWIFGPSAGPTPRSSPNSVPAISLCAGQGGRPPLKPPQRLNDANRMKHMWKTSESLWKDQQKKKGTIGTNIWDLLLL